KLSIAPFFQLNNAIYEAAEVNRFQFIICLSKTYYLLKKIDWRLVEDISKAGTIDHKTFLEQYKEKLKRHPLDLGGAFKDEIREASPEVLIQISELGGNMLLFLPRWDYDGTIVDDDKD